MTRSVCKGRKRGSRNRGFFYRKERKLWCATAGGKFVPLLDEHGERLRDADTPPALVKAAYARYLLSVPKAAATGGITVWELAKQYLQNIERTKPPHPAAAIAPPITSPITAVAQPEVGEDGAAVKTNS